MKARERSCSNPAFTLIELMVVIAIIGILIGLMLPVLAVQRKKARITLALVEMTGIATAIASYQTAYSLLPVPRNPRGSTTDLTWGTINTGTTGAVVTNAGALQMNNSEVIAILAALEHNRDGTATVNLGHTLNPRRSSFLNFKYSSTPRGPGVGDDGVYRDPWGNPYIISIDLGGDGQTSDALYRLDAVSLASGLKGHNGLMRASSGGTDDFVAIGQVIIWSFGPDGLASSTNSAMTVPNLDNLFLSR